MRTKRFLSIVLTLAMLVGMFPSMSLTTYADGNTTEITPTNANGTMNITLTIAAAQTEELLTTITATGKEQASYSTDGVATVSFSYTAGGSSAYLANWGWWGYGWTATVTPADGYTITKCVFYDDANRTATDSSSLFVVETTEEDKTPRINGTPIDGGNYQSKGITKIEVYGYAKPAPALDPVSYMAWNGTTLVEKTDDDACTDYTVVTADTTTFEDGKWYVVSNSVTVSSRITVTGTVNLILCDGATLTASKGITVNSGNTINIYAQSAGTGELSAGNDSNAASIGGGARYQSGGTVNIHGGKITATGGDYAAGIGGALDGGNGEVNIYGGNVTAQGNNFAAGIGGYSGKSGGTVSIYGGTVNASGSVNGVGIGIGGTEPGSCIVNIYGGDVTAGSGKQSGIQGTVNIGGGTVTANGGTYDSSLRVNSGETTACNGISGTVTISGGTVTATGGNVTGDINNRGGNLYACNGIGGTVTINGGTVTATGGSHTGQFNNSRGTTVKEKGFGGSLTLGTGMYLYGGTSANPESDLSNYRAGAGDYIGDRYVYMTVNNVVPHIHSFTYTATGATITAACTAGCDITEGLALTISAPTELTYDGSAKAATLSTGYNTTAFPGEYMIKYYKGANEVEAANVKAAGDYTAKVTVGEATASVDFTIAKATPSIETIPTASAITHGQSLANSTLTGGTAKLGDNTVAGTFAWKNTETKPAVSDSNTTEYAVMFNPTDTDNYAAVECKVKLTVNRAEPTVTVPTAKTPTYNGSAQKLVNAGSATGGTMYYAVTTDNTAPTDESLYTTSIPTKTDAGTYYVWYKVEGDANHNNSEAEKVAVTISQASIENATVTLDKTDLVYTGSEQSVQVSSVKIGETVLKANIDYEVAGTTGTNKGDYTVTVTGKGNYKDAATAQWHIAVATPVIDVLPTASAITYGQLLSDSTLTEGTAKLGENAVEGTFSWKNNAIKPAVSDSEKTEYVVVFTPKDTANYNTVECKVKVTVNKALSSVAKAPAANTLTYNGKAQELVNAGEAINGTMSYAIGKDDKTAPAEGWGTSIPTATNAGTYYVWYKAAGDANHNDSATSSLKVTIDKKEVTVVAANQTVALDGSIEQYASTDDVPKASVTGAVAGHVLDSVTLTATGTENVTTTGTITPSGATIKSGTVDVTDNYAITYQNGVLTVTAVDAVLLAAPQAVQNLIYNGSEQTLVTTGTAQFGTMSYALGDQATTAPENGWSATLPAGTDAGNYYVWYRVAGDANHLNTAANCITVTIGKASCDAPDSTAFQITRAYSRRTNDGKISGVQDTMEYSTDGGLTWIRVETGKRVIEGLASGTVQIRYAETANYLASSATVVTVGYGSGEMVVYFAAEEDGDFAQIATYNDEANRYEFVYTGAKVKPAIIVEGIDCILTEGVDYTISYSNNQNVNAKGAPAKVTVTGKGNYTKKKTLDFYILPKQLDDGSGNCAEDVEVASVVVTAGKSVAPVISYNGIVLKAKDFTVTSSTGNLKLGATDEHATISITGKGNYAGTIRDIPVTVLAAKTEVKKATIQVAIAKNISRVYNGEPQMLVVAEPDSTAAELTVTNAAGQILTEGTDFVVSYSANVNVGTVKVTVIGIGDYTGSVSKSFKIVADKKQAVITAAFADGTTQFAFRKNGVTPQVIVTETRGDEQIVLAEGTDYKLTYSNNKKVGTKASCTVRFLGNYKGRESIKQSFEIVQASLLDAQVTLGDAIYTTNGDTAQANQAKIYVSIDGVQLTRNQDYTVTYWYNDQQIKAGKIRLAADEMFREITVKITGKGSFKQETIEETYRVERKVKNGTAIDLSKARIYEKGTKKRVSSQAYTGEACEPAVDVYVKSGKSWVRLDENLYNITYVNNVERGTARILVNGNGAETIGSKTVTFKIGKWNFKLLNQLLQ